MEVQQRDDPRLNRSPIKHLEHQVHNMRVQLLDAFDVHGSALVDLAWGRISNDHEASPLQKLTERNINWVGPP